MNILYQIPGAMSAGPLGPGELARRRSILQGWARVDTVVEVADSPGGPLSIESHAEEFLCIPPMMRALHARAAAPDAVIIGCFGDPGLAALRETLDCPVVGPLESSFLTAAQLGQRVGIVTVLDSVVPVLDHIVRGMGMSLRYAGAAAVNIPVLDLHHDAEALPSRIASAARPLMEARDADVLVLGCMSMAFLGAADRVSALCKLPVVNPARCALHAAEALVAQGLGQSRRTYPRPRKPIGVEAK
jgi:allantoin racemase